jgi:hypothetical protein
MIINYCYSDSYTCCLCIQLPPLSGIKCLSNLNKLPFRTRSPGSKKTYHRTMLDVGSCCLDISVKVYFLAGNDWPDRRSEANRKCPAKRRWERWRCFAAPEFADSELPQLWLHLELHVLQLFLQPSNPAIWAVALIDIENVTWRNLVLEAQNFITNSQAACFSRATPYLKDWQWSDLISGGPHHFIIWH